VRRYGSTQEIIAWWFQMGRTAWPGNESEPIRG
jgi:hypothetical protein